MKYKMLVKAVLRQNQPYTGKEIKEMTIKRMQKFDSEKVDDFYNKYFGNDPNGYRVNMNHEYLIKQDIRGVLYLKRVDNER